MTAVRYSPSVVERYYRKICRRRNCAALFKDKVGSIASPVKELKDFQNIKTSNIGETKTVKFIIDKEKLSFFQHNLNWQNCDFDLMIVSLLYSFA